MMLFFPVAGSTITQEDQGNKAGHYLGGARNLSLSLYKKLWKSNFHRLEKGKTIRSNDQNSQGKTISA